MNEIELIGLGWRMAKTDTYMRMCHDILRKMNEENEFPDCIELEKVQNYISLGIDELDYVKK